VASEWYSELHGASHKKGEAAQRAEQGVDDKERERLHIPEPRTRRHTTRVTHTTHDTRHTTHDTRHTTHDTRHTTRPTARHTSRMSV
jgi:hypothetical protein